MYIVLSVSFFNHDVTHFKSYDICKSTFKGPLCLGNAIFFISKNFLSLVSCQSLKNNKNKKQKKKTHLP
jgi:hypothetical protein